MTELEVLNWDYPGGGSGPIPVEDEFMEYAPNSTAICTVGDDGGHTKLVRLEWGVAAVGDISRRFATRLRNSPHLRDLFLKRHNQLRVGNLIISSFTDAAGDTAGGLRLAENAFRADYVGRTLPVSNESNIHIRTHLTTGETVDGEDKLDELMKTNKNVLIDDISFFRKPALENEDPNGPIPIPYEPALKSLRNSDLILGGPGSWEGSTKQVFKVPGVFSAIAENDAPFMFITNAVDIKGRTASQQLKYMSENVGRKIDLALVDSGDGYNLPQSYKDEYHFKVIADSRECFKYANEVITLPFARDIPVDGIPTIRHVGKFVTYIVIKHLVDTGYVKLNKRADTAIKELGSYLVEEGLVPKVMTVAA